MSHDPVDIPKAMTLLGQCFHQDALYGQTVENVLCQFTYRYGANQMRVIQRYMSDSLVNDTMSVMEEKWLQADSELDFEEYTDEFFQKVVNFDPVPCIRPSNLSRLFKRMASKVSNRF